MSRSVMLGVLALVIAVTVAAAWVLLSEAAQNESTPNAQPASVAPPKARPAAAASPDRHLDTDQHQPGHVPSELGSEIDDAAELQKLKPLVDALRAIQEKSARATAAAPSPGDRSESPSGSDPPAPQPPRFAVTRDGIQDAIKSAIPDIRECYEAWLQLNPKVQGKLTIAFQISPDETDPSRGVVDASVKEGGLGEDLLDACVVASVAPLVFDDPPEEGVSVVYPLTFRSE